MVLPHEFVALTARVDALTGAVRSLTDKVGGLTGEVWEMRYRDRAHRYFGEIVRRVRVLTHDQRVDLLEDAVREGRLTEEEADEVEQSDLILLGVSKADGKPIYVVAEVSAGKGMGDVARARKRASLFAKVGVRTLPVVAGSRIGTEAAHLAEASGVWQLMDGSARAPHAAGS